MKTTLFLLLPLVSLFAKAQTIEKSTFATAGGEMESGQAQIAFTIGEPIVSLVENGTAIDQGFWACIGAENTLGTTDLELDNGGLIAYPNPVKDYLSVKLSKDRAYSVSIYSLSGQKLVVKTVEASAKAQQIDISALAKGIYLLQLKIPGKNAPKPIKIIKN